MGTARRATSLVICSVALLAGCYGDRERSGDSAAGTTTNAATGPLAAAAGTWNLRSVPETGDTTAVVSVLTATADTTGWMLTLQNRPPIPVRVRVEGDSIITVSGPYESVMRPGVQVTTTSVFRVENGMLVGRTAARYATSGADSVLRLSVMGHRAP